RRRRARDRGGGGAAPLLARLHEPRRGHRRRGPRRRHDDRARPPAVARLGVRVRARDRARAADDLPALRRRPRRDRAGRHAAGRGECQHRADGRVPEQRGRQGADGALDRHARLARGGREAPRGRRRRLAGERVTAFWHPFADMKTVAGREIVLDRGEGVWVWDTEGRRYLDASGGHWYANVGHGRRELADAAAAQLARLAAYSAYDRFATRPALELAERVAALAPIEGAAVFLTTAGSDAVETAVKLVRRYWSAVGRPERQVMVARERAYHGVSGYGTSLVGIEPNRAGFGELAPNVVRVPHGDADAVAAVFAERAAEVAAFIGEPVIGAGGVHPPPDGYWPAIERLCREHDVLLVLDEVITGFGRLGEWFGAQRYGVVPDLFTFAKGVTSGYVPLGGVVVGPRVQEPFWRGDAGMFRHGYTYSGHAAACAVALANLDLIERERLVEHVRELEPAFAAKLRALEALPGVREVRTAGLLAGIEVDDVERAIERLRGEGVLTRVVGGTALQISPPFVLGEDDVDFLAAAVAAAAGG